MLAAILSGVLTSCALAAIFVISRRHRPAFEDGRLEVRYAPGLRIVAWVLVTLSLAMVVGAAIGTAGAPGAVLVVGVMLAVHLGCWWMVFEFALVHIDIDDEALTAYAPWRRPRRIEWRELREVSWSSPMQWFTLRGGEGPVRAHLWLSGLDVLIDRALSTPGVQVASSTRRAIESLRAAGSL